MSDISVYRPLSEPHDWNTLTAIELLAPPTLDDRGAIRCDTSVGGLIIRLFADGMRLSSADLSTASPPLESYGLMVNQPQYLPLTVSHTSTQTVIDSDQHTLLIGHSPFTLELTNSTGNRVSSADDGHFVRRHRIPPLAKNERGWWICLGLQSGEPVYGLGEKWGGLNKRGQLIHSYNRDALGVNAEYSYKNVPFCWSPQGWGAFFHTPAPVTHAIGYAPWSQRSYCALLEDERLDFLLFCPADDNPAPNPGASLLRAYTDLTGRATMPPNWSGGVILSKAFYQDADEILAVAHEVRRRQMPCDVITFDGRAWQDTDTRFAFEWSPSRYPNPKRVIDELKQLNFKVCVWEYPLISVKHEWFKMFAGNGWLLTDVRTGDAYQYRWDRQAFDDVLTPLPLSGIVDFTHPQAYAFWRDAHRDLFELGVDMIKADFGEQLEDDNMLAANGERGQGLHNVYAHLYNRCVFEAAERYAPSGPFLFSRSSWTGCQRFNSQWGGDPQADWEGMAGNIRGGLSWGLSGAPFYATDVGGFYKDTRDDVLYVRWVQAAVFSAHFRLHGIGAREPWSYSEAAENAAIKAIKLRYRLQAYLQHTMQQSCQTGLPVQRPMVLAFPQEKQSWAFENQFMFGDDLLVVLCLNPAGKVEFYLPAGDWQRFDIDTTGQADKLTGGQVYQQRIALDEVAVFARVGASIPLNQAVEFTEQLGDDIAITDHWSAVV